MGVRRALVFVALTGACQLVDGIDDKELLVDRSGAAGTSAAGRTGTAGAAGSIASGASGATAGGKSGASGATAGGSAGTGKSGAAGSSGASGQHPGGAASGGTCGDGVKAAGELCDGADLGAATCASVVAPSSTGNLACKANCSFDVDGCTAAKSCGNGVLDAGEPCDGSHFANGKGTCEAVVSPASTGTIVCTSKCTLDPDACTACGNGKVEGTEACDGADIGGATCASVTMVAGATGTPKCTDKCVLSPSGCTYCGNGAIDPGEQCDGSAVGAATCATVTKVAGAGGVLGCAADCSAYVTTACAYCGNGRIDPGTGEACDKSDLGALCTDDHPGGIGTYTCTSDCTIDKSQCTYCGDGVVNGTEACDDAAPPIVCPSGGGTMTCLSCQLSTGNCTAPMGCGNGMIDGAEQCDETDLNGATCASATGVASATGILACNSLCGLDTAACTWCGNGRVDGTESCDGGAFGASACVPGTGQTRTCNDCNAVCACADGANDCGDGTCSPMCCPPLLTYCDNTGCVDTTSDSNNCGGCNRLCQDYPTCINGTCSF